MTETGVISIIPHVFIHVLVVLCSINAGSNRCESIQLKKKMKQNVRRYLLVEQTKQKRKTSKGRQVEKEGERKKPLV